MVQCSAFPTESKTEHKAQSVPTCIPKEKVTNFHLGWGADLEMLVLKSHRTKGHNPLASPKKAVSTSAVNPLPLCGLYLSVCIWGLWSASVWPMVVKWCSKIVCPFLKGHLLALLCGKDTSAELPVRARDKWVWGWDRAWITPDSGCHTLGAVEMLYCFSCPELFSSSSIMWKNTDWSQFWLASRSFLLPGSAMPEKGEPSYLLITFLSPWRPLSLPVCRQRNLSKHSHHVPSQVVWISSHNTRDRLFLKKQEQKLAHNSP